MKPPYHDCTEIRQAVIDACLEMNAAGINQGTSGNISVRAENHMLITPSGVPYEKLAPEDLVLIPLGGSPEQQGQLKPSTEWPFHMAILQAKPGVNAVVHAHPIYCSALAMNRQAIPACHYMIAAFGGMDVRCAGYHTFGSPELASMVIKAMEGRTACLLANHGMVAGGKGIEQAMWRAVELETIARQFYLASQLGDPVILSKQEMDETFTMFAGYGVQDS